MPFDFDTDFQIQDLDWRDEVVANLDEACAQLGAEVLAHITDGAGPGVEGKWPVETGKSVSSLDYRLDSEPYGYRIVIENVGQDTDYAYWVERRWYPFLRHVAPYISQLAAAVNRDTLGRTSRRIQLFGRDRKYHWRTIDIRRAVQ